MLLASMTDRQWEAEHQVQPQPWDTAPIVVRTLPGVLGIFDAGQRRRGAGAAGVGAAGHGRRGRGGAVRLVALGGRLRPVRLRLPRHPAEAARRRPGTVDAVAFPVFAAAGRRPAGGHPVRAPPADARRGRPRPGPAGAPRAHPRGGRRGRRQRPAVAERGDRRVRLGPAAGTRSARSPGRAIEAARAGFIEMPADDSFNDEESTVAYGCPGSPASTSPRATAS